MPIPTRVRMNCLSSPRPWTSARIAVRNLVAVFVAAGWQAVQFTRGQPRDRLHDDDESNLPAAYLPPWSRRDKITSRGWFQPRPNADESHHRRTSQSPSLVEPSQPNQL